MANHIPQLSIINYPVLKRWRIDPVLLIVETQCIIVLEVMELLERL